MSEPPNSEVLSFENVITLDPRLLEILVCPVTKTTLEYHPARQELVSHAAHLAYPIRNGIPIMLVSEARSLQRS